MRKHIEEAVLGMTQVGQMLMDRGRKKKGAKRAAGKEILQPYMIYTMMVILLYTKLRLKAGMSQNQTFLKTAKKLQKNDVNYTKNRIIVCFDCNHK